MTQRRYDELGPADERALVGDVGSGVDVREERFEGGAEGDVRDEVDESRAGSTATSSASGSS